MPRTLEEAAREFRLKTEPARTLWYQARNGNAQSLDLLLASFARHYADRAEAAERRAERAEAVLSELAWAVKDGTHTDVILAVQSAEAVIGEE